MKTVHFTSGLPRACSTLLQNLLAQNPEVHATATSGVHEMGYIARDFFETEEFKTFKNPLDGERQYLNFVKGGVQNAFNDDTDRPVVVDKCRSWIGHLDQLYKVFPDAKVLVPVRDVRGILSSFEKLRIKHPSRFVGIEKQNPQNWTTIEKRSQGWLNTPPLGIAVERLHDAIKTHKDKLHFVHAEDLTSNPVEAMNAVWDYLEMDRFEVNPNNVEQYTDEHELGWPYGEHKIRSVVKPLKPDWHNVLGKQFSEQIKQSFDWINQL